jgi:hypothetical protein
MPTPLNRESLNKSLEQRYESQKIGGAFNAKDINTKPDSITLSADGSNSIKGQQYTITKGGFRVKQPLGLSDLADVSDRKNSTSKRLSDNLIGFNNKKYKQ